jgi:hypothetical protein
MSLSYADAVMLMGGKNNRTVVRLDGLLGGLLRVTSAESGRFVLSLFDSSSELAEANDELVREIGQRLRGLDKHVRSDRFAAAHTVITLAAYFEALGHAALPFAGYWLPFSKADQVPMPGAVAAGPGSLLGALEDGLLRVDVPMPSLQQPAERPFEEIRLFYSGLSTEVARFAAGLPAWGALDAAAQAEAGGILREQLPGRAVACYEERFRRLAVEFPELAFWTNWADYQVTRPEARQLGAGLAALERMLSDITGGRIPDGRRLSLSRAYRDLLRRPVLTTRDAPPGSTLPLLGDAYVIPDFKAVKVAGSVAQLLSSESWWGTLPVRSNLEDFLFGYLVSPQAAQAPLLVLGQPGSGKSALTQMLAAQLPPDKFLVVRVVLREASVDADLQTQIEEAVRAATGEALAWPDLVRGAVGALPVVLLDGFDELLQATGVSQTDYIAKVANFQAREAALGRPVAIVITSRTAVADRSAVPPGTVVVRLEPFHDTQIRQWLDVWNHANAASFAARGLQPLAAQVVLEHTELASQPLLLIMLALYDADGNRLQQATAALALDESELYERLLVSFAEREVRKSGADLPERQFRDAVERELLHLSVVALAMFTRSRQWVSETELDSDLPALLGEPGDQVVARGLRAPLTAAQVVVGRFFFIHEAQATRDNTLLHTYEFLHATYGEYLIARLVTRELEDLADAAMFSAARTRREPVDDAFLYALLSYIPLTMRGTVVAFAAERMRAMPSKRRQQLHEVLLGLFSHSLEPRRDSRYGDYVPVQISSPARYAGYSANLAVLAAMTERGVTGSSLFPGARDPVAEWRKIAMLWRSQLPREGWDGMIDAIALDRIWPDESRRDIVLRYNEDDGPRPHSFDAYWSYNRPLIDDYRLRSRPFGWSHRRDAGLPRQAWFLCDPDDDTVMYALEPFERELDGIITSFHSYWPQDDHTVSTANSLIKLLLMISRDCTADELTGVFNECLDLAIRARFGSDTSKIRESFRSLVLWQLVANRHRVPQEWLNSVVQRIRRTAGQDSLEVYESAELLSIANRVMADLMANGVMPAEPG